MKGIILAGGNATRLYPNTAQISKQLLPVYKAPMIFYPLDILIKAGIKEILIIVSPEHSGRFINLLDPLFHNYGIKIFSKIQEVPRGISEAFILGEPFINGHNTTLILGDNIFEDTESIVNGIRNFQSGGHIFLKKVTDPQRFGIAEIDKKGRVLKTKEKPRQPKSNWAITGAYIYDKQVTKVAKKLKPSRRGELEITDLHNFYLKQKNLKATTLKGAWLDAGTMDSYLEACLIAKRKGFYEKFDPIILKAIEKGRKKFKNQAKKMLK